uniref:Uncharacterized protein n=1 Tax=Nelumbo nucifera TaxID=4432 RepID=A0A822YFC5_NELNU|nr:TPA_asm: hypothetical protein HUJ06_010081 [Nelumbo nucifera]
MRNLCCFFYLIRRRDLRIYRVASFLVFFYIKFEIRIFNLELANFVPFMRFDSGDNVISSVP